MYIPFISKKIDDKFNLNIFNKIGLSNYILQFHQNKKINNPKLSFHYDILFALGQKFKNKKINILEIGTYEGEFANFLSNVFPDGNIYTLELPLDDETFKKKLF